MLKTAVPRLSVTAIVPVIVPVSRWYRQLCTLTVTYPTGYVDAMDAVLHAISDASRRTVLEALGDGDATAGELAALLPIARPGVSRHLRVLREAGLVEARQVGQRRVYSLRPEPLAEVDDWLARYRSLWEQRLDALHTEIARGKKQQRSRNDAPTHGSRHHRGVATGR
jgi:DNA-binding transcriptional ArsR family regulator